MSTIEVSTRRRFANLPRRGRALDGPGLARRITPFALIAVLAPIFALFPPSAASSSPLFWASIVLLGAIAIVTAVVPWNRLPSWPQMAIPLAYLVCVGLLRDAGGGAASGFGSLVWVSVFWVALYGNTRQLVVTIIAGAIVFFGPPLVTSGDVYPDLEFVRGSIWLLVTTVLSAIVNRLMGELTAERSSDRAQQARVAELKEVVSTSLSRPTPTLVGDLYNVAEVIKSQLGLASVSISLAHLDGRRHVSRPPAISPDGRSLDIQIADAEQVLGVMELRANARLDFSEVQLALTEISKRLADHIARRVAEEASERQKRDFLDLVSHELNTPLTSLTGYLRLVRDQVETTASAPEIIPDLDVMERNVGLMSRLVGDLIFSASVDTDDLVIEFAPVDVRAVVESSVQAAEPLARSRDVKLIADFANVSPVSGDRDRLAQAVDNLIANAIKFNRPGGEVLVRLSELPSCVVIEISDDGPGISADDLPHIFDRFYRGSETATRTVAGLGLGLTVADAVVRAHLGAIDVQRRPSPQTGTTFSITLPAYDEERVLQ